MSGIHNTLGNDATESHGPLWQTVANLAALNALTVDADDVAQRKLILQSDTGQIWYPTATTPTFALVNPTLGAPAVVATIAARNNIASTQTQVGMTVTVLDNGAGVTVDYILTALPGSSSANWSPKGLDIAQILCGTGKDGSLAPGFGTLTLADDAYYLDISPKTDGTDIIITNGYKLRWSGTLDLRGCPAGTIRANSTGINGANGAAGGGAGAGGAEGYNANRSLGGGRTGGAGGAGGTVNGSQGTAGSASGNSGGGDSGTSGAGGAAGANTGGANRAGVAATANAGTEVGQMPLGTLMASQDGPSTFVYRAVAGGAGGGGGGGGAGDLTAGGGGGGGGSGGGCLDAVGNVLYRDGTTAVGCINANGGTSGNGGSPGAGNRGGGGAAGGAGGGVAMLATLSLQGSVCTGLLTADGADGGNGGNGSGTGLGGLGGTGGKSGLAVHFNLSAGTRSPAVAGTAGSAPGAPSGATGGTGGAGGQSRVNV